MIHRVIEKFKKRYISSMLCVGRMLFFDLFFNNSNKKTWVCLLLLIASFLSLDAKKVNVEWERIPGVKVYRIELKNSEGKILLDKKTTETFAEVDIPPGNYFKKLTLFNKLEEKLLETEWTPLNIINVLDPILDNPNQKVVLKKNQASFKMVLMGKHFTKDMEIIFRSTSYTIKVQDIIVKEDFEATINDNLTELPSGSYDLVLKSPSSDETKYSNFLVIEKEESKPIVKNNYDILRRSAIFPGWGQYYSGNKYSDNNDKTRSYIYGSIFVLQGFFTYFNMNHYNKNITELNTLNQRNMVLAAGAYQSGGSIRQGFAGYTLLDTYKKEREILRNVDSHQTNINLLIGIYLVNLIDAYFLEKNHDSESLHSFGFFLDRKTSLNSIPDYQYNVIYSVKF